MGFRINTNVVSLNTQRNLRSSKFALDKSLERLASGQRINRASDDAAGLAVSEGLRSQIRGLEQANRNTQDGISLVQIAEGSLSQVANILVRLRELAIQAASDTLGNSERGFLDVEFGQLKKEVDRVVYSTDFNGVQLFNGFEGALDIQIGTGNDPFSDRLSLDLLKMKVNIADLGLGTSSVRDKKSAQSSIEVLDKAVTSISKIRADLGSVQNRLQVIASNHDVSIENLSAANSLVRDTDLAKEAAEMTKGNILVKAGTSVLAQANQTAANALGLLGPIA